MTDPSPSARFLLPRVESSRGEARCVPVRSLPTLEEALTAAAEQPDQPNARWEPGRVDGVWRQIGRDGRGFMVHRIDGPADPI